MKSVFVLGLALAASAQVDNELATSLPYHPSGADLVKYAGQSQHTTYRPVARVVRDDEAAEDELMVYYTKDSRGGYHYEGGYTRRDDEADDELVSLSGADLVKYAKQSQQTVYRPVAHVVRDDETENELHLSGADLVKYAKQSQQTVYRPTAHVVRDDEAENELHLSGADLVKYAKQSQQTVYRPTAHVVRDDEAAEDELMVYYTKDSRGVNHYQGGYTRKDDAADDELVQTFYSPSGADLVKYAKQSQQTVYRPTAHVVRDDEVADSELAQPYYPPTKSSPGRPSGADLVKNAGWGRQLPIGYRSLNRDDQVVDDELVQTFYSPSGADLVKYAKQSQQTVYRPTAHVVRDDETAEDELMVYYTKDSRGVKHYEGGYTRRDDAGDDELVQTFYSPSGADLVKYAKQSQQTVYRPTAHVVRDDETAEDELMVYYTKDSRGVNHYQGGYTRRDDEVDDELALLGQLIKEIQSEKKPEIRRNFRHAEKN